MSVVAIIQILSLGSEGLLHVCNRVNLNVWWTADGHIDNLPNTQKQISTIGNERVICQQVVADNADEESIACEISPFPFYEANVVFVIRPLSEEEEYSIEKAFADDEVKSSQIGYPNEDQ